MHDHNNDDGLALGLHFLANIKNGMSPSFGLESIRINQSLVTLAQMYVFKRLARLID